jgi:hypothetical protein
MSKRTPQPEAKTTRCAVYTRKSTEERCGKGQKQMGFSRNYRTLTAPERFALMVEALARDDQAEADRLEDSCPKLDYRHNDCEFRDRLQRSYTLALLACVNLQKLLAVIRCSNVFIEQHRVYADGPKERAVHWAGEWRRRFH